MVQVIVADTPEQARDEIVKFLVGERDRRRAISKNVDNLAKVRAKEAAAATLLGEVLEEVRTFMVLPVPTKTEPVAPVPAGELRRSPYVERYR